MTHDRETLAAAAARIIVESELTDWALARRKAADALGLPLRGTPMPSDEQIIAEIRTWHALYGGKAWVNQLRSQRLYALDAMHELARFRPVLTGPVAEGWAHAGSEIRIELTPENSKEVEYALMDLSVDFEPEQTRNGQWQYVVVDGDWPLRLVLRNAGHPPEPRFQQRFTTSQVEQLLRETPSYMGVD